MNLRITILSLSICWASSVAFAQQNVYPFLAETTSQNINIRSGQSVNFEILARLEKGEELVVLGKLYSWYKVVLPLNAKSYLSADFFLLSTGNQGVIVGDRVNVRAGAGPRYTVLGQLSQGDHVVYKGQEGDWVQIEPIESSVGWISDQFIKYKSDDVSHYMKRRVKKVEKNVEIKKIFNAKPVAKKETPQPVKVVAAVKKEPIVIVDEVVELIVKEKVPIEKRLVKKIKPKAEEKVEPKKEKVIDKRKEQKRAKKELNRKRKAALKLAKKEAKEKSRKERLEKEVRLEQARKRVQAQAMAEKKEQNRLREEARLAEMRKAKALEARRLKQKMVTPGTFLSLSGILVQNKKAKGDEFQYILLIDGNPSFFIEGLQFLFDDFLNYTVMIDGTITSPAGGSVSYPIVSASKIEYVL